MYSKFCKTLGLEHGIFAFSHCRDVVAAVSNHGGMGVLKEALTRPKIKLIANALGTPPAGVIKLVKGSGRLIGALCGQLKQALAHKQAGLDAPDPLGMPLQGLLASDAMHRTETYAGVDGAQQVAMNPAGQVVGQINEVESCRGVINRLLAEYVDALGHVNAQLADQPGLLV